MSKKSECRETVLMPAKFIDDKRLWDKFVDNSTRGLLFHKWDFLKLLEKYSTYQLLPYGIYKGHELICIFPLYSKKVFGQKVLFSPPPRLGVPFLGPVMDGNYDRLKQNKKEAYMDVVAREIDSEISRISPHFFQIYLLPDLLDIRSFINLKYQAVPNFTYTWNLARPLEDIWNSFSRVCKQNISKGLERNYQLEKSSDHEILVEFLTERYAGKGKTFSVNSQLIGKVVQAFPDACAVYYLSHNGEKVSGVLTTEYKNRLFCWHGLPKPREADDSYANEVLLWKLMEKAKLEGFTAFEVCGADTPQICSFRNKLNPQLELGFKLCKKDLIGTIGQKAMMFL